MKSFFSGRGSAILFCSLWCLGLSLISGCGGGGPDQPKTFELTIIHTNDVHSALAPEYWSGDRHSDPTPCNSWTAAAHRCWGGYPRIASIISQTRLAVKNSLLLDAGDQFEGSIFFDRLGGAIQAPLMNMMGYDAMTIGNHELDNGISGLVAFLQQAQFPVLSSNINYAALPQLSGLVKPYTIVEVAKHQIGIIGATTVDEGSDFTKGGWNYIHSGYNWPNSHLTDPTAAVKGAVVDLQAQGVNIIIFLSHLGVWEDMDMARRVSGINIIVGGHSHYLLSNQYQPAALNVYPTVVMSPAHQPVLVVAAAAYSKYMGRLTVTFDENEVMQTWMGDTLLLDDTVPSDPDMLSALQQTGLWPPGV